ncbi:MAG TPA: DUF3187 family protein [Thermoanaerobaculia bacterium]|nr:DUF3187 family protein [Thermoanaerobaculia bacterium]
MIRARRGAPLAVLLAAATLAARLAPGEPLDPAPAFGERSFHLLHVPFLDFGPADPSSPAPGEIVGRFEAAYASTFSSTWHALTFHDDPALRGRPLAAGEAAAIHAQFPGDRVFFVESDLLRVAGTARAGLTPTLSVSAEIVWISHDAIHGGSAVEAFHRAFGLDQSGRNEFPASQFAVMVQRPGGEMTFDDRSPDPGFGDTTAMLSWRPARRTLWSYGLDAAIKAPTGSSADFNGSGSWDAGALGYARRDGPRWTFDTEAGVVVPGRWRSSTGLPVAWYSRLLVGATRAFGPRTRVGASATLEESPFRRDDLGDLSHPGLEIALGVERDLSRRTSAALTLTENVPSFGDRADFGLTIRLRFR